MAVERAAEPPIAVRLAYGPLRDLFGMVASRVSPVFLFERIVTKALVYHLSNPNILRACVDERTCAGLFDADAFDQAKVRITLFRYKERRRFPWLSWLGAWVPEASMEKIKSQAANAAASKVSEQPRLTIEKGMGLEGR